MHDVTEGGLATALEEFSTAGNHRIRAARKHQGRPLYLTHGRGDAGRRKGDDQIQALVIELPQHAGQTGRIPLADSVVTQRFLPFSKRSSDDLKAPKS
jgi:hypothetical protein